MKQKPEPEEGVIVGGALPKPLVTPSAPLPPDDDISDEDRAIIEKLSSKPVQRARRAPFVADRVKPMVARRAALALAMQEPVEGEWDGPPDDDSDESDGEGARALIASRAAKAIERALTQARVLELRLKGEEFYAIGQELGMTARQAADAYRMALKELPESRGGMRRKEILASARLLSRRMNRLAEANPTDPDVQVAATRVQLDILKLTATLTGAERPKRHEVTGKGGGPVQVGGMVVVLPDLDEPEPEQAEPLDFTDEKKLPEG